MADSAIIKPITILIDKVKLGDAIGGTLKLTSGTERAVTNTGTAFTDGISVTDMTWKTLIPRRGMRVKLLEAVLGKKLVVVQYEFLAKLLEAEGKLSEVGVDWTYATGACEGNWSFLGGESIILG
jgi:hypothetical protein